MKCSSLLRGIARRCRAVVHWHKEDSSRLIGSCGAQRMPEPGRNEDDELTRWARALLARLLREARRRDNVLQVRNKKHKPREEMRMARLHRGGWWPVTAGGDAGTEACNAADGGCGRAVKHVADTTRAASTIWR